MPQHLSISHAAAILGVAISTLRRWEAEQKLIPTYRTKGGHRRYSLAEIYKLCGQIVPTTRKTIAYARVSSHDQKADLARQAERLRLYCEQQQYQKTQIFQDLGSGLNYQKKFFKQLLKMIALGEVERLVITTKDRLLRFGASIIFQLCELQQTEVIILDEDKEQSLEKSLVADVIELMTVFSARLHGSRSRKNMKKS